MKKKLNEEDKNMIKGILAFLLTIFIMVFASSIFQQEENPLQNAIIITGLFACCIASIAVILRIVNYLTKKNVQFNKLSKVDFLGNKELYRDILSNYSPVMLAYLDKMQYNYDISIVAGLLSLKNKGFIEFKEDKINIIKFDFYNLELPERYIIENIKNGKVEIEKSNNQLKEMIFEEGKRKNLLLSKNNWMEIYRKSKRKLILFIIIIIIIGMIIIKSTNQQELINMIFEKIIAVIFGCGGLYISFYVINYQKNPYIRNKSAEELNEKLEGLKNYLKDYSLLKDKESEDIVLWEEYLIYSVIFNQNNNIIEEYRKYY